MADEQEGSSEGEIPQPVANADLVLKELKKVWAEGLAIPWTEDDAPLWVYPDLPIWGNIDPNEVS